MPEKKHNERGAGRKPLYGEKMEFEFHVKCSREIFEKYKTLGPQWVRDRIKEAK